MYQEKKFFAPILRTYNEDLSKRWRIEYYSPITGSREIKRVIVYGNINKGKTVDERKLLADLAIKQLGLDIIKHEKRHVNPNEPKSFLHIALLKKSIVWEHTTLLAYKNILNNYFEYLETFNKELNKITSNDIDDWLLWLKRKGATKNKLAKYRNFLGYIYNHSIKFGLTKYNPVTIVQKIKSAPQSLNYFSEIEVNKFKEIKNEIPHQLWIGILLQYYCAIRPKESCMLKIGDFDYNNGYIIVPASVAKNDKSQRVRIPDQLLPDLEYLMKYPKKYYIFSKDGIPGIEPITRKKLYDDHKKILNKLKIYGRYSYYSWKHTGAVRLVKSGINIKDIQLHFRHHSLDMTDRYLRSLGALDSEDLKSRFPSF